MGEQTSANNKRIVKNTLYMYFRMLFIMCVTLYTSRIILHTLGVEDFGIYNIVGGVVVLFSFINQALSSGTQRHISFELGKKNGNITAVFSACLNVHIWLSLIIFIFAETVGLWFVNTQMNFPEGRMTAINWVYQFSVLTCIINIIRVPYNAAIIAYEYMSFYAYIGIIEAIMKLAIVFLLNIFLIDKLFLYAFLLFIVSCIVTFGFYLFCKIRLKYIHLIKIENKSRYKFILSFSGWAMFGSVATIGLQEGINIIINIFYGVILNAAVGIANQVNSAVAQFVGGFQQALNPQLVKSQAEEDHDRQFDLIFKSAKFSYLIMIVIAFPLFLNLNYILSLWLGKFPAHTLEICQLIIIGALIECLSGPLWLTIFATGRIKAYQIVISSLFMLNIPLSYIIGKSGMASEVMFVIRNLTYVAALFIRLIFIKKMTLMSIHSFIKAVIYPILIVTSFMAFPYFIFANYIHPAQNFVQLFWQTVLIVIYETLIISLFGLKKNERRYFINIIGSKISNLK